MSDLRQRLADALEDAAESQAVWAPTLTVDQALAAALPAVAEWLRERAVDERNALTGFTPDVAEYVAERFEEWAEEIAPKENDGGA